MKIASLALTTLLTLTLAACDSTNSNGEKQLDLTQPLVFDFAENDQSFKPIFSDYPVNGEAFFKLSAEHRALPAPFADKTGWWLYGSNHSDDLLMAIKGRIAGVRANTLYRVALELDFISNVEGGCFGVGGSPGDSVFVKLAAATKEPVNRVDDGNHYRISTDVGNQANGGTEGKVVGNIANGDECLGNNRYREKTVKTQDGIDVMSDDNGEFWVMALTDSGFEAATEIHMTRLTLRFVKP